MSRPATRNYSLYFDYPRYPFTAPAELRGASARHHVAIAGAGPVGLTAALELARHGVASVVLDDKGTVNDGSRATCIARHSLEILQQLGLSDRFVQKALGWTHGTSYYRADPVFRLEMPHSANERFLPMYNLQQQYMEKFLVDRADALDLVDLRWHSRVTGVQQDRDGVALEVETPGGGYTLHADYLLAADGARSVVRSSLGLKLKGEAYEGRYVIADACFQSDYPTERRAFFDPPANPGSTVLVHRQPDNIWRIDYQLRDEEDEQLALREDSVHDRVAAVLAMIGERGPWELEWWSIYKAYSLALDDYRCGRVLFIGDAAHLVPIFGVRGLNSGYADAVNAGWKLAYVLRGWAPDRLLDSYSPERRGATLEVFENANRSTRFMTPPTRGYALMREAALSLAVRHEFTRPLINPRQSQPYTYRDSPLTAFPDRDVEFERGPAAGAPLVNHRLGKDDYLLDHLGLGFTGVYFPAAGAVDPALAALFAELDVGTERFQALVIARTGAAPEGAGRLVDAGGALAKAYGAQDGTFYLVRPDRHVCARWTAVQPDEVRAAFRRALMR
ncbi:MAG: FAD-dependent monooxygenase [Gammaproteobacteria bacterium]|nr:FAD-dependent monooxygenase [Gammaproteobacteria bacterium]